MSYLVEVFTGFRSDLLKWGGEKHIRFYDFYYPFKAKEIMSFLCSTSSGSFISYLELNPDYTVQYSS